MSAPASGAGVGAGALGTAVRWSDTRADAPFLETTSSASVVPMLTRDGSW